MIQVNFENEKKHTEHYRISTFDKEKHTSEDYYFDNILEAIIKGVREVDKGRDVFFLELIWGEMYDVSAHINTLTDKIK